MKVSPIELTWNSGMSIYASEAFLRSTSDDYGWIGGTDSSGQVRCVLPYSRIRKAFLCLIRFPVQTIMLNGDVGVHEETLFLNAVAAYFRATGADVIVPATFNTVFRTYPEGAMAVPFGSYVLDLGNTEDALWNNLHSKHRNVIRSAAKKGVKILFGPEHLETAYELVRDSFIRSAGGIAGRLRVRLRLNRDAFKRQIEAFGENVKVFVAEYKGDIQGCAVIPFSGDCAYYMHGGSVANPLTGAMNLLQWEAIRFFQGQGVRQYDFFGARIEPEKGSKLEGIAKFKERFGGKSVHGYMWKLPLNSPKYFLYSLAAKLRNGGDIVDQERHKLITSKDDQCLP